MEKLSSQISSQSLATQSRSLSLPKQSGRFGMAEKFCWWKALQKLKTLLNMISIESESIGIIPNKISSFEWYFWIEHSFPAWFPLWSMLYIHLAIIPPSLMFNHAKSTMSQQCCESTYSLQAFRLADSLVNNERTVSPISDRFVDVDLQPVECCNCQIIRLTNKRWKKVKHQLVL